MLTKLSSFAKILSIATLAMVLTACGTPVTKPGSLSDAELRQERQAQQAMAKQYQPKKIVRKHKDVAIYKNRLQKVAAPLATAAKQLCKRGRCEYQFLISERGGLNAWTDGKRVIFTPEMLDFLETDKELATVIAHELSHNVMGHHAKQRQNAIIGSLVDMGAAAGGVDTGGMFGKIGSVSYSQGFENEADYVGIYLMALAGYDVTNVHNIWRKMTIQTGTGTNSSFFGSHPSNPERFVRMKRAIEEVQAKQQAGQKLVPNYKA